MSDKHPYDDFEDWKRDILSYADPNEETEFGYAVLEKIFAKYRAAEKAAFDRGVRSVEMPRFIYNVDDPAHRSLAIKLADTKPGQLLAVDEGELKAAAEIVRFP